MTVRTGRLQIALAAAGLAAFHLSSRAATIDSLGQQVVPTGATYQGTQVGGLSGTDFADGSPRAMPFSDNLGHSSSVLQSRIDHRLKSQ